MQRRYGLNLETYSAWLQTDGRSRSYISAKIFRFQPRCPIEAVAMCLAIDGFQEAVTVTARLDRQAR